MKHLQIFLLAVVLLAVLCAGCAAPAQETAPTPSPEPVATSVPAETPDPSDSGTETGSQESIPPAAGSYAYTDPDDGTAWTLTLRENGTFTLREDREDGTSALHTGESWAVNPDGSVTCGPTDIWQVWFSFSGGCSTWTVGTGGMCQPVPPEA